MLYRDARVAQLVKRLSHPGALYAEFQLSYIMKKLLISNDL